MSQTKKEESRLLKESCEIQPLCKIKCSWESINFKIRNNDKDFIILDDISGSANPNKITAIMGESGSGKTSLLSILSGTIQLERNHDQNGFVKLNGNLVSCNMLANYIRFIEYEPNIYECFTPYEFLYFRYKLQSGNSCDDKPVRSLIKKFGLEKVEFAPMGGALFRGISDMEKEMSLDCKRTINLLTDIYY